jgi:hypothetical protein
MPPKEKKSNKKYIFTLKGIDTEKVDKRFGITIFSILDEDFKLPVNSTKISDLNVNKNTPLVISFLDEAKKNHKCVVSMIDFQKQKDFTLESHVNMYDCFWCKHSIPNNIVSIGCPIKYVPNQAVKTYYSEISKDKYTIKENITNTKSISIKKLEDSRLNINNNDYYLTDGIFCSFNCCMAFILDNSHNSIYDMSEMLLLKMYNNIHSNKITIIEAAPHWRKRKEYGGELTIAQYRNSFNKIEYKNHGMIIPQFKSIGLLFEEKLKF